MLFKRTLTLAALLCVLMANSALATIIDTKQVANKVYFLNESPNKILVYDLENKAFDNEIILSAKPTAFTVSEDAIYINYGRILKWINLTDSGETYIRNTVADIETMAVSKNRLFYIDASKKLTTLNLDGFENLYTKNIYSSYSFNKLTYSETQHALYVLEGDREFNMYKLNKDGQVIKTLSHYRSYNENSYTDYVLNPFGNIAHINVGESKIAFDLSPLPDTPLFEHATFAKANLIGCDQNRFVVYNQIMDVQDEQLLSAGCDYIAYHSSKVFTFDYSATSSVQVNHYDISEDTLINVSEPLNPDALNYHYDLVETDSDGVVYLYDRETLQVNRWSLSVNKYLTSIKLKKPITTMAINSSNSRLYVGRTDASVAYFDLSQQVYKETEFAKADNNEIIKFIEFGDGFVFTTGDRYITSWDSLGNKLSEVYRYSIVAMFYNNETLTVISNNHVYNYTLSDDGIFSFASSQRFTSNQNNLITADATAQMVINSNGVIHSLTDGSEVGVLSSNIRSAAWVDGQLVTIAQSKPVIQFWSDQYELLSSLTLSGAVDANVFQQGSDLILVRQFQQVAIDKYDGNNITDSDRDGKHDLEDNCKLTANSDQKDTDSDFIGNACDNDDDNDGLPDTIETEHGLDPLDSSDALLDLDQDGFSNLIEHMQNSDMSNNASLPIKLTDYSEGFNAGWPLGFYVMDINDWTLHIELENGRLISNKDIVNENDTSSVFWAAYVAAGVLQFKTNRNSISYENFAIYVDGEKVNQKYVYSNSGTAQFSISLKEGAHIVEFRVTKTSKWPSTDIRYIDNITFFLDSDSDGISDAVDNCPNDSNSSQHDSDNDGKGNECDATPWGSDRDNDDISDYNDNCPDTYNPDQANIDNDSYGDACDLTDNRPKDSDNDGLADNYDNCPFTSNYSQKDLDYDGQGDVCDLDIDGDGMLNTVENSHLALDPLNPDDAYADFDNDGASNQWEVANGKSPDTEDSYKKFNLFEYMPLGKITYVYGEEPNSAKQTITPTGKSNQFKMNLNDQIILTLDRNESGIYISAIEYINNNQKLTCENYLFLPATMVIGEFIEKEASCNFYEGEERVASDQTLTTKIELLSESTYKWKDEAYPSLIFNNFNGGSVLFVKGMGQINALGENLSDFIPENIDKGTKKKSSSGIGQINAYFLFFLVIFITLRKKKH